MITNNNKKKIWYWQKKKKKLFKNIIQRDSAMFRIATSSFYKEQFHHLKIHEQTNYNLDSCSFLIDMNRKDLTFNFGLYYKTLLNKSVHRGIGGLIRYCYCTRFTLQPIIWQSFLKKHFNYAQTRVKEVKK